MSVQVQVISYKEVISGETSKGSRRNRDWKRSSVRLQVENQSQPHPTEKARECKLFLRVLLHLSRGAGLYTPQCVSPKTVTGASVRSKSTQSLGRALRTSKRDIGHLLGQ